MKKTLIASLVLLSFTSIADTVDGTKSIFNLPKLNANVILDGNINDDAWGDSLQVPVNNMVGYQYDNVESPFKTTAYVFEDGEYLYVAFDAKDKNPEQIKSSYKDRDKGLYDDSVGIKLDPYNQGKDAYSFHVNAHNSQIDSINTERGDRMSNYSWDAIWESSTSINDDGFTAEMKIPLSVFSFDETKSIQDWGVLFMRIYPRESITKILSAKEDRDNICLLCQMDVMTGLEGVDKGMDFRVTPSLVYKNDQFHNGDSWETENEVNESLDIRWGVTSNMLMNFTYNPDFSAVDLDTGTLSANERFSIYTEEKRNFFNEESNSFKSPSNFIHTRNIVLPNYGIKLTGTKDDHSYGVFYVDDKLSTINVVGNEMSQIAEMDGGSHNFAGRYSYNVNEDFDIGLTATLKSGVESDYHNFLYSTDFSWIISDQQGVNAQLSRSHTQYEEGFSEQFDGTELKNRVGSDSEYVGNQYFVNYWYEGDKWKHNADIKISESDFKSDLGFEDLSDFRMAALKNTYVNYIDESFFYRNDYYIKNSYIENNDGDLIRKSITPGVSFDGSMNFYAFLEASFSKELSGRIDQDNLSLGDNAIYFDLKNITLYNQFEPITGLALAYNISYGDEIDYENNRKADGVSFFAEAAYPIGQHLELSVYYDYLNLDFKGNDVLDAHVIDLRAKYHFNNNSSIKVTLIYNNTQRNQGNYTFDVDEKSSDISSQLLYTYKINPQTLFYAGYSELKLKDGFYKKLTDVEKNYFAKISYAFQM